MGITFNPAQDLATLKHLKEFLNQLPEEQLNQPILFGLTDDDLEDHWEIMAVRPLVDADLENIEDVDMTQLKEGRLIFQPYSLDDSGGSR